MEVTYDKTTLNKLTVTANDEVKIKVAKSITDESVRKLIVGQLSLVALQVLADSFDVTMRGKMHDGYIVMMNDSRKLRRKYYWNGQSPDPINNER